MLIKILTSKLFVIILLVTSSLSCTNRNSESKGGLFIIGGGERPQELMRQLAEVSGVDKKGYVVVLPMSSEEPDSAVFYLQNDFKKLGIYKVYGFNFNTDSIPQTWLDSLLNAKLIFVSGGDQNKFMKVAKNQLIYNTLHRAYQNGAIIAGTSAGAAIMSKKMITGNEIKYPEYTGNFRTIESGNIEIGEGMGFLTNVIIDQHFVVRMRMNRLISVVIENPDETAIGIDESTAIFIQKNKATVFGVAQVIVMRNRNKSCHIKNERLGAENLELNVYLPGDSFPIEP